MLLFWKMILRNWINCYVDSNRDEQINNESLLNIITRLRENVNVDESETPILEAHTVEEFICSKFPEFKFENGTVEATDDEEICLSASLLLFFVCVNSKNLDRNNEMCSKLSFEDQEIISKYNISLIECPVITVEEVEATIAGLEEQLNQENEEKYLRDGHEKEYLSEMHEALKQKDIQIFDQQSEINRLEQMVKDTNSELTKQSDTYATSMLCKTAHIQNLQETNEKVLQAIVEVVDQFTGIYPLLTDTLDVNMKLNDKLKDSYVTQMDDTNKIIKLTHTYAKAALDHVGLLYELRKLQKIVEEKDKYLLKTNAIISSAICEALNKTVQIFKEENIINEDLQKIIKDKSFKDVPLAQACEMIIDVAHVLMSEVALLKKAEASLKLETAALSTIEVTINELVNTLVNVSEEKSQIDIQLQSLIEKLTIVMEEKMLVEKDLNEKILKDKVSQLKIKELENKVSYLSNEKSIMELEKKESHDKFEELKATITSELKEKEELVKLKDENENLLRVIEENKTVVTSLGQEQEDFSKTSKPKKN